MAPSLPLHVILLRAIGPATHRLMRMEQWRAGAEAAGFVAPETLVNTGNMIAGFDGTPLAAERAMVPVLRSFGLGEGVVPVVRPPALLQKLMRADPIAEAGEARPAETAVFFFAAARPKLDWVAGYKGPEKLFVVASHLVVDFRQPAAQSGRLLRLIGKQCGVNTARNWNTTRKLAERCAARERH